MLRRFMVGAAVAAGLSVMSAPSWAATADSSSSVPPAAVVCDAGPDSPCAAALCPPGTVCVPSPKACFTTPCPQFDCVPVAQAPQAGPLLRVLLHARLWLL
ncbi:hypothetical protein [Microbispora sp. NPDC049125]|uniref:hypothetical protein n=1 Tax=Microbispora sp. NPDC049125 TaxID=3154929 RepID=UPI003466B04A